MAYSFNTKAVYLSALLSSLTLPTFAQSQPHYDYDPVPKSGNTSWQEAPRPVEVVGVSPGMKPVILANWFASLEAGGQRYNSNTMYVNNGSDFPSPSNFDTYTTNKSTHGFVGLSAGHLWQRNTRWLTAYSIALRYRYLFPTNIGGNVIQYSLPEFNNYDYTWKVDSNVLTFQGKLNILRYGMLSPYVGAGLGIASNNAERYSETPHTGVTPRISPGFSGETNNNFTYNAGIGVDIKYTPKMFFTVGYEYQTLGNIDSGYGVDTWSGDFLEHGRLTSHLMFIGFTYLIDNVDDKYK